MAMLRQHFEGVPIPPNFSWHENYKGNLWKETFSFAAGSVPFSLNESMATLWMSPEDLVNKFGDQTADQIKDTLGDDVAAEFENDPHEVLKDLLVLLGKLIAFTKNLECISIYGKSLNKMIIMGRDDDYSLLDAVRIDNSLISEPYFQARINRAHLLKHVRFLAAIKRFRSSKQ
jgi:hypothetical protein